MNAVEFADQIVKFAESEKQWKLSYYQRTVLTLMYECYYMARLWSEPKKSSKTFLAAVISLWEALVNREAEIVCCANDQEQAISRVFQTRCRLIK